MKPIIRRVALVAAATFALTTVVQMPLARLSTPTQALTGAGAVTELQITGRAGVPTDASAAVVNLTSLDSTAAGFVTAYPCGNSRPYASNLNYTPGTAIANSATVPIGTGGKICLYTSPAPLAPAPKPTGQFVETFDGNAGLDRFNTGIYHREGSVSGTVSADHDLTCGSPGTQRTVSAKDPSASFYTCRDHLMTAIGDWAGYSTGYFSPKQTFSGGTKVSWDVNVTDLGARQWWEVAIVPASFNSGVPSCPQCAVIDWMSPDPTGLPVYPEGSVVVGNGPFGKDVNISYGRNKVYSGWQKTCDKAYALFPAETCASKAIRLPFSVTDNKNGTITVNYGGVYTKTFSGSFPAGGFNVVFKDHNYTPNKDGMPIGHTWHWDNIIIK